MDTILDLLRLGAVGTVAGLFSAYLATRGHRNRKWWEKRVAAYQSVIEALSDVTHYYDVKYKAEIMRRELSAEQEEELRRFWDSGYHSVRKAADTGSFLFSDDVNKALREFVDLRSENYDTYFEYLDAHSAIAEKCLKTVVACSKRDLRVSDTWL